MTLFRSHEILVAALLMRLGGEAQFTSAEADRIQSALDADGVAVQYAGGEDGRGVVLRLLVPTGSPNPDDWPLWKGVGNGT